MSCIDLCEKGHEDGLSLSKIKQYCNRPSPPYSAANCAALGYFFERPGNEKGSRWELVENINGKYRWSPIERPNKPVRKKPSKKPAKKSKKKPSKKPAKKSKKKPSKKPSKKPAKKSKKKPSKKSSKKPAKKSKKKTIAEKRTECTKKGLVYDTTTKRCRKSKRGKKSTKSKSKRKASKKRSRKRKKKTIAEKRTECTKKGLVYDTTTKRCRKSKRGKKSTKSKSKRKASKKRSRKRTKTGKCTSTKDDCVSGRVCRKGKCRAPLKKKSSRKPRPARGQPGHFGWLKPDWAKHPDRCGSGKNSGYRCSQGGMMNRTTGAQKCRKWVKSSKCKKSKKRVKKSKKKSKKRVKKSKKKSESRPDDYRFYDPKNKFSMCGGRTRSKFRMMTKDEFIKKLPLNSPHKEQKWNDYETANYHRLNAKKELKNAEYFFDKLTCN